jgi:hypothetical protein
MADGPFKSMTPDPESRKNGDPGQPAYRCASCGRWVYAGDWPWCRGKGGEGHKR